MKNHSKAVGKQEVGQMEYTMMMEMEDVVNEVDADYAKANDETETG